MCVIIRKPEGIVFPDDLLENCADNNPHGWGIMYPESGRVRVVKSMDNDEFLSVYETLKDLPLGIHFRYRTHGNQDLANAHPFQVLDKDEHGQDLWVMHNGVISGLTETDKRMSDTWHFVEAYLRPILSHAPDLIHEARFRELIDGRIGSGSKLLFLDGDGRFATVGDTKGTTVNGCWLSNSYSHNARGTRAAKNAAKSNPPASTQYGKSYAGVYGGGNAEYDYEGYGGYHGGSHWSRRAAEDHTGFTHGVAPTGVTVATTVSPEGKVSVSEGTTPSPSPSGPSAQSSVASGQKATPSLPGHKSAKESAEVFKASGSAAGPDGKVIPINGAPLSPADYKEDEELMEAGRNKPVTFLFDPTKGIVWFDLVGLDRDALLALVVGYPEEVSEFLFDELNWKQLTKAS